MKKSMLAAAAVGTGSQVKQAPLSMSYDISQYQSQQNQSLNTRKTLTNFQSKCDTQ